MPITIAMDIYVARQPVCNGKQKVIGYELLYRSGLTNSYGGPDGTNASLAVVRNAFLSLRQRKVPQASQVFINLTGVQSAHILIPRDGNGGALCEKALITIVLGS